jgi:GNAT superfamily N-acetyltransferase
MATVRPATPGDAGAIARIYVDTWRATYAGLLPDKILVEMSGRRQTTIWSHAIHHPAPQQTVLVANDGRGPVVGFGSCGRARYPGLRYEGEVFTLYVQQDHQGRGIGKLLLGGLFQGLLDDKARSALIWVLARNPARFFYEAMGGRRIAEREERLWGARLPETAYGWPDLERALGLLEKR